MVSGDAAAGDSGSSSADSASNKGETQDLIKSDSRKSSYANIVKNKQVLSKFDLEQSTVNGLAVVPEEVLEDKPLWEDFLVGRFLSTAPHVGKIHAIVKKIWPLGDKTITIDVYPIDEKMARFRIRDSATRSRVLRRGMWNIADISMVIAKWSPVVEEEPQQEISSMPMWVTLKKVPHTMFSWKGLSFIASKVGEPKRLHPDTEQCTKFEEAKVFVEANLTKELPKSHKFYLRGKEVEVDFSYPWLPLRCGICGKWGHRTDKCSGSKEKITILTRDATETGLENKDVNKDEERTKEEEVEKQIKSQTVLNTEHEEVSIDAQKTVSNTKQQVLPEGDKDNSWISPTKRGRHTDPKDGSDEDITSPSRYSLLAVDVEDEEEEVEEGELPSENEVMESMEMEIKDQKKHTRSKQEEAGMRPSLPRASKAAHKVLSDSAAQQTKEKPIGGTSRRVQQKQT